MLTDSGDFFGYNMYTSVLVSPEVQPLTNNGYDGDMDLKTELDPSWKG